MMKNDKKGLYHNDYSPRYQPAYNIYDKAREHMKQQKKNIKNQKDNPKEEKK